MAMAARGKGKNKQYWKDDEVKTLVDVLQELDCDPLWKVDGGLKNNYTVEVHKMLLSKIPNFDKDVDPHIDSKIKWLRNKYNPISEMCMQSGCQWDDVEHKINCEKQWFDEWCLNHKNTIGMWNFKFPHLRKLDMVWGKDRATGLKAEDIAEASDKANSPKNMTVYFASDNEDELVVVCDTQGSSAIPSSNYRIKRRKNLSPRKENSYKKKGPASLQNTIKSRLDNFTAKFESICEQMTSQYASVTNALITESKSDSVTDEKMQELMIELLNIGIPQMDVGKAALLFCNDLAKVQVLFALPSHLKKSFVLGFLYPSSSL